MLAHLKIDTKECPNIYSWPIYSNIRIYSSHSESDLDDDGGYDDEDGGGGCGGYDDGDDDCAKEVSWKREEII